MPVYKRTYDALGRPTGTIEYSVSRQPRNRIGCFGKTVLFVVGALFLFWPLDLQPHVLSAGAAWGVVLGWWCLLATIPLPCGRVRGFRRGIGSPRSHDAIALRRSGSWQVARISTCER